MISFTATGKKIAQDMVRKFGFNVSKFNPGSVAELRRQKLMNCFQIDAVLDIGANTGQFGAGLRRYNYRGKIISFEPLNDAYGKLGRLCDNDPLWESHNFAVGARQETTVINIAQNSQSSSLLPMLSAHLKSAPESAYVSTQQVEVKPLDAIFDTLTAGCQNIYLKIDTQGYEMSVLTGAQNSLQRIDTVQLEMSLVPLYRDESLFNDLYQFLESKGYRLCGIQPGFSSPDTGELLQMDGIFHRYSAT